MAATKVKSGYGAKLLIGDGATPTEVFTEIAEIVDINDLTQSLGLVDATHMGSPDGYSESIPTFKSTEPQTFTFNWVPTSTSQRLLETARDNRSLVSFRVTLPQYNVRIEGKAYVTSMSWSAPHDNKTAGSVTLAWQGKPELENADGTSLTTAAP